MRKTSITTLIYRTAVLLFLGAIFIAISARYRRWRQFANVRIDSSPQQSLNAYDLEIEAVTFSPDGKLLATAGISQA